jgi:hypothetical protein
VPRATPGLLRELTGIRVGDASFDVVTEQGPAHRLSVVETTNDGA